MKRIITCSDGTWNTPDELDEGFISPTNVSQLTKIIAEEDNNGIKQFPFYDPGVGTGKFDKYTGGVFGEGINNNIIQAYQFIVENYEPGDEIYLFGFSRGAYTARSVAGFIRNSGLLQHKHLDKMNDAFKLYRRRDDQSKPNEAEAIQFKSNFCHPDVRIKFIGVWDTVGSLGLPLHIFDVINKEILDCCFHDTTLSSWVDFAYQALAIDEHRVPFRPTLWQQQPSALAAGQVMEQRWFSGVHADIGGGYHQHGLSDCSMKWMLEKAECVGLKFKDSSDIIPNALAEAHDSMSLKYEIFGIKNRIIGNGPYYNETISPSVIKRLNANTQNYKNTVNPFLAKFQAFKEYYTKHYSELTVSQ